MYKTMTEKKEKMSVITNENYVNHPLSIYIHIPFCERKCHYCDFLSAPASKKEQERYVSALLKEIEYWGRKFPDVSVKSVYFGGGTPSILEAELLVGILCKLKEMFPGIKTCESCFEEGTLQPEITIEINPGTVTEEKLLAYKQAGINRLSIGLQSADNKELMLLGRIHTYEKFLETYHMARNCGFDNINIDLISGLPGQKVEDWKNTLKKVLLLKPEHISAYSLIIEEGTPFFESYNGKEELLPDEETDREMYALTKGMLKEAGYNRYEISNYSKAGRECAHNIVYWQRGNYIGLGLGSSSMVDNVRFQNRSEFESYVNFWQNLDCKCPDYIKPNSTFVHDPVHKMENVKSGLLGKAADFPEICKDIQFLTTEEQMEEFMFLGLRMMEGVSVAEFEVLFGKSIFEVYRKQIETFESQKLLAVSDRIALTDKGIDVSNVIFAEFLLS